MKEPENSECCPKFDPNPWHEKILEWKDKKFVKDKVFTFFYMPINFGAVVTKMMNAIEQEGGHSENWISLSDHTSMWNMDIYLAVDKEIKGMQNLSMSGTFLSKVYEGDFKETGEWCKDFQLFAEEKGKKIKKMYMWYTTCPKCAKKYGKNYVVLIAEIN